MSLKHCIKQVISYKAGNKTEEDCLKMVAYNLITRYQASFLGCKDGEQKRVQYNMNEFAS